MGRVGRFQVMATLQAARAQALGLNHDEARSWGLNRAVFYAAAKRGFRHAAPLGGTARETGSGEHAAARAGKDDQEDREYVLGGEKAYVAANPARGVRFKFGDEEQTPRDFEWQVERRFNDWPAAWAEAVALVEAADPANLQSQHRFYEQVYKPLRDKLAARWTALPTPTKT
jgi:hypothetical protein